MARVETDKNINPTQLGIELGRKPVRHVAGRYVDVEGVGAENLQAAVDAHIADDNYVDPNAPPPEPTKAEKLEAIRPKVEALPTNNPARAIFLDLIDAV